MDEQTLGRYRLLEKLGSGGMGDVYLGQDTVLGRRVAIKLVKPEVMRSKGGRARFLREARALAGLNHPNIAVLYEVGESEEGPYLVMEYVEGRSLKDELILGPLPNSRLREVAAQICSAVEHAHQSGVLHRDIKSGNILLTLEGTAKVCDFGLAKFLEAGEETQSQLTGAGTWVGTLHYCAPEVVRGHPADRRSDIYSLGVVLYEMSCGRLPFEGLEGQALVAAVLSGGPTPLRRRNPTVGAGVERAVERAMAHRPEDRFASAAELAKALAEAGDLASEQTTRAFTTAGTWQAVAVLDFENVSGDPASDWLGTGLAETLTADLKKLKLIRVIGRERIAPVLRAQSAPAEKGADAVEIGRQLGARWIIAGSYQRAGSRLRITPRLVETATGEVVATAKVDGEWENVFNLQDHVVADLMQALELQVDSSDMERIAAPETQKLEAYELYARGRKKFHELGKNSLEEARQCFEKAVGLDSQYQMAYSGLGATYAMRYVHRTDPDDLARAVSYLERAIELDSELGEPYPWLCYAYMRQGKVEQAIEAGRRGVQAQPDLVQAHYFLGAAYIVGAETNPHQFQDAAEAFLRASEVDPRWEPLWLCLGEIALNFGDYSAAEYFLRRLQEIGSAAERLRKFVGSDMMLGSVWLRHGDRAKSLESYRLSLDRLAACDHMYREAFLALTACGLGDLHLREGKPDAALAEYRRALRTVKEFPRMLGQERVLTRTTSGMAAGYAASGDMTRARELFREAATRLESVQAKPQTWIWEASTSRLYHSQAVALARLLDADGALDQLERAVTGGWRDAAWLQTDPELIALREKPRFRELLERLRALPAVRFASARGQLGSGGEATQRL